LSGLVNIENPLDFQLFQQTIIPRCDRCTGLVDNLGKRATAERELVDITKILADRCKRRMTGSLEESDDARQFRLPQTGFANFVGNRRDMGFVARLAKAGKGLVFSRLCRLVDDFDLLHLCDWPIGIDYHWSTAIGTTFVAVEHQPIEFIIRDLRPNDTLISFLATLLSFLTRFESSGRLYHV